ncbi:hypothetical protein CY35_12G108900 [Sphagnum magellanicum]|nr:hypothetical protein CY35_12G108900 [Sphagnum magellanicum]
MAIETKVCIDILQVQSLLIQMWKISEFSVSGNPVFRDRSIQGECVGPEIPLRPSLPNFTLVQKMSQRFTSALKTLLSWGRN